MKENITDNEKKEILEMAKMEEVVGKVLKERTDILRVEDLAEPTATALHKAGYRKQCETVKEFAEKLKAIIDLDRNKEAFLYRPRTAKATDYWLKEWYDKCNMLNDLVEQFGKEEI